MVPPILIAERRIARQFMRANAVRPADAIPFTASRSLYQRAFARLREAGVIIQAGDDRWYLDPPLYEDYRVARRERAVALIALAIVLAAVIGFLTGSWFPSP